MCSSLATSFRFLPMILPASRCGLLQAMHDFGNRGENLFGGISLVGFGIDAEEGLSAGRADHHPADIAEVEFDAVHVFAICDRQVDDLFELRTGKVFDRFFLLTGLEIEVDAAIMIFAEFLVKS